MTEIEDTLEERGRIYGDYRGNAILRAMIMASLQKRHMDVHGTPMSPEVVVWLGDIVAKLARIAVTPRHVDSWHDVEGYATLVNIILEENE